MSYNDGWAAINLEMPNRVPRTEYSIERHWELIRKVTGIHAGENRSAELQNIASASLYKAWNYDFIWSIMTHNEIFGDLRTKMGHASYLEGGVDYDDDISSAFADYEAVLAFDPAAAFEIPGELSKKYSLHYKKNCLYYPNAVNMTGIYVSCMSGLLELFGWTLLLEALGFDPKGFGECVKRYGRFIRPYFEALADSNAPVVMIHDDLVWTSGPFASPAWYREYIFPTLKSCVSPLVESGKKIAFTCDGNFTAFIDDIADLGVHGFVIEPTTDMKYIAEKYGKTHFFIGNADTRALAFGSKDDIENEVSRCMEIGKKCAGYFMAVGNHIPANTPVENALWYNECYEKMSRR
jgi:hypothetical protein